MSTLQNTLGYTEAAATALYGEYTFGMTLFMLPPSFIYPLSVSLMPAVSAALTRRDRTAAGIAAGAALTLTVLAGLPAGEGLSVLAGPILQLLYPAVPETAEAAAYHLTFLGLACVFVCLTVATNGVLQAYGHPLLPVISLLCGGVLKIGTNYLMVGDPATNVRGAPVSALYCYALIVVLNLIISVSGALSAFEMPYVVTGGGFNTSTYFVVMDKIAHTDQKVGLASAMAVVLLLLIVIVTYAQKAVEKWLENRSSGVTK